MVSDVGEGIDAFVAISETRQIVQPKNHKHKYDRSRTKLQNRLTAKNLVFVKATTIWPSFLTVFQSLLFVLFIRTVLIIVCGKILCL